MFFQLLSFTSQSDLSLMGESCLPWKMRRGVFFFGENPRCCLEAWFLWLILGRSVVKSLLVFGGFKNLCCALGIGRNIPKCIN